VDLEDLDATQNPTPSLSLRGSTAIGAVGRRTLLRRPARTSEAARQGTGAIQLVNEGPSQ